MISFRAVWVVFALLLVVPGAAQALDFGHWRVTASGSVTHEWKLAGRTPCADHGFGRVTANAHGRTKRFRLAYYERDGFRQWEILPPQFHARGKVLRKAHLRQRAPKRGAGPCSPIERNGCGVKRRLTRRTIGSVEGTIPQRKARVTLSFYNVLDAFPERSHCYTGRFGDFNNFPGAPFANYGRMVGRMPAPGSVGRRAFTVSIVDTHAKRRGSLRTKTVRRVKLRFRPTA